MKSRHHTSCARTSAAAGWLAILSCLLVVTPSAQPLGSTPAPATAAAAGAAAPGVAAGAAECSLYILGGEGRIERAGMRCTGPQATIALATPHLAAYTANFTGVTLNSSCGAESSARRPLPCLVKVCSGRLVLKHSSVSWVRGIRVASVLCVLGDSKLEVHDSDFSWNQARPLAAGWNSSLLVNASTLSSNSVNASGGVILVTGDVDATVIGSQVHGNNATDAGGGMFVGAGHATLSVVNCSVSGNSAGEYGGGLAAYGDGSGILVGFGHPTLKVVNSSVSGNSAGLAGGGLAAMGNVSVSLAGGSVQGNTAAEYGGGLWVIANASATLSGAIVQHNTVLNGSVGAGGGLWVGEAARVTLTGGSIVHSNNATGGAGLCVLRSASVNMTGGSSVHSNTAKELGGGLFCANGSVTITGSSVYSNTAGYNGGGLAVRSKASVIITGSSSVHSNTAGLGGGGLAVFLNGSVTVTGSSSVHSNTAGVGGGGLAVFLNGSVTVTGSSSVHSNTAGVLGGGLAVVMIGSVTVTGSMVHSNRVLQGSGGGLSLGLGGRAVIREGSTISNNTCFGPGGGGGIAVEATNSSAFDMRGRVVDGWDAVEGSELAEFSQFMASHVTISSSTVSNNTSFEDAGGGLVVHFNGVVKLVNRTVLSHNSAGNSSGGGAVLVGNGTLHADDTVVFVDNTVNRGYVGSTIAAYSNSTLKLPLRGGLSKCDAGVYLGWSTCRVGEVRLHDACMCCPAHTFSFANVSCEPCPRHGNCTGGSLVQPLPGYWSSAPTTVQMHRCPLSTTACNYTGPENQCNEGYKGPLCGACTLPEFGMLSAFRCVKCMLPKVQLVLYMSLSFVSVFFVTYTVHATWRDNRTGRKAVLATDLIKVLVLFLQYTVIIGSVAVPWPLFDVQRWFLAVEIVFAVGSGQALSLDCWLYHYIPQSKLPLAMQRQLVYFLAPVVVWLAVMLLQSLAWAVVQWVVPLVWRSKRGASQQHAGLVRKLPVSLLVLAFYAYPTLLRASLSFSACLRIDRVPPEVQLPPGATAPLSHTLGYWVSDITQQCFAGYHRGWALGLGLPSVFLWCIVVPVAMGMGLYLCRAKADEDSFREHFGFLYRSYRPERMWWEAVWAARTVVLTLISVFAYPMERYFAVLSLLVVFLVSAVLQIMFKPYAFAQLHRMHLVSTSCLATTTLGALAMFAYEIQEATALRLRIAIAVLVILVNVTFVGWCVWKLVPLVQGWCLALLTFSKAWGPRVVEVVRAWCGHPAQRSAACAGEPRQRRSKQEGSRV